MQEWVLETCRSTGKPRPPGQVDPRSVSVILVSDPRNFLNTSRLVPRVKPDFQGYSSNPCRKKSHLLILYTHLLYQQASRPGRTGCGINVTTLPIRAHHPTDLLGGTRPGRRDPPHRCPVAPGARRRVPRIGAAPRGVSAVGRGRAVGPFRTERC